MSRHMKIYLTEEQTDRLSQLLKDMPEYQDIYNDMSGTEYCDCFDCENNTEELA